MQLPLCVKRSYICCRYILQVRFLADLVNCHVVTINSLFLMFDTFVDVCLEDNVPQVRQHNSQITMLLTYDEKCTDDTIRAGVRCRCALIGMCTLCCRRCRGLAANWLTRKVPSLSACSTLSRDISCEFSICCDRYDDIVRKKTVRYE